MAFLEKTIGNNNVKMWYRCIITTIDFRNKTNFQLFSLFFQKHPVCFSKEPIRIGLSVTSFIGEIQPGHEIA